MHVFKTVVCVSISVALCPGRLEADIVTPTSATATSSFVAVPDNLINGSGLSGMGDIPDQTHDNNENNMWIAGLGSQAQNEELEFTFDFAYDLSSAIIWQYNGIDGFGSPVPERGINEFEMLVSPDLTSSFVSIGTFNLAIATNPLDPAGEAAQTFGLSGATGVRRVKFDIISAHGGVDQEFVGLSEVRFEGTQVAVGPDRTWITDGVGDWLQNANWDPALAPNANDQTATFGGAITASSTVVADEPITVKRISFDNVNSYVIAGAGEVNLDADSGNAALAVAGDATAGAHQFQAIVNLLVDTDANVGSGASLEFVNRLNLNGHTLTKTGEGTLTISNTLNTGGGSVDCQQGVCAGAGSIGGSLNNSGGTVAPGTSTGVLTVGENYTQSASASLSVELDGTVPGDQYDQLVVSQTATLDGALDVEPLSNYADPVDRGDVDEFALVTAGSIEGTFADAAYAGTSLTAGANYVGDNQNGDDGLFRILDYEGSQVTLTNYLALPGDANGDLVVDVSDFNIWNSNKFEGGTNWTTGDFNGDGSTDVSDFNVWNTNKFRIAGEALGVVPEPSVFLLIATGLVGLGHLARGRFRLQT